MQRCHKNHRGEVPTNLLFDQICISFFNREQVNIPSHPRYFKGNLSSENITI